MDQIRFAIAKHDERIEELRSLTMEERGQLIVLACRAAARIEQDRELSGLEPVQFSPPPGRDRHSNFYANTRAMS